MDIFKRLLIAGCWATILTACSGVEVAGPDDDRFSAGLIPKLEWLVGEWILVSARSCEGLDEGRQEGVKLAIQAGEEALFTRGESTTSHSVATRSVHHDGRGFLIGYDSPPGWVESIRFEPALLLGGGSATYTVRGWDDTLGLSQLLGCSMAFEKVPSD